MTLHLACAADESYVGHCAAMLHSVVTRNPESAIQVHFLHDPGFSLDCQEKLRTVVEGGGGRVRFLAIEDSAVAGLPVMGRIPRIMWYRVFLPERLPEIDRVLYLDADTLAMDSLRPLWETDLGDGYVAAVSGVFEPHYADRPRALGLPEGQEYFNSGVLLFNLEAMRADRCTTRIVDFARGQDLLWPDQDALNVVLGGRRVHLHPRWNCMNSLFLFPQARTVFGHQMVRDACRDPGILHFEGPDLAKPWHYLSKHPFRRAYRRHRAETPWPKVAVEGRTWQNRLLKPLPARATIKILTHWPRVRARLRTARLRRRPTR